MGPPRLPDECREHGQGFLWHPYVSMHVMANIDTGVVLLVSAGLLGKSFLACEINSTPVANKAAPHLYQQRSLRMS